MKRLFKKINSSKYLDYLIKGIYAGAMIAIGGVIFLALDNKIVGSFLFSIGLLTVCMYGMNLFTGKIGYVLVNKINYVWELLVSLLGNFIGAFTVGMLMRATRFSSYIDKAVKISNIKLNDDLLSIFILSIFCGVMMYIAVNNYKKVSGEIGKYIGIFLCVMVFILAGFEHCVANMFYFTIASAWSSKALIYMIIMILGNTLGSVLIASFYNRFYKN